MHPGPETPPLPGLRIDAYLQQKEDAHAPMPCRLRCAAVSTPCQLTHLFVRWLIVLSALSIPSQYPQSSPKDSHIYTASGILVDRSIKGIDPAHIRACARESSFCRPAGAGRAHGWSGVCVRDESDLSSELRGASCQLDQRIRLVMACFEGKRGSFTVA